jgi:uncharacterized protein YggE
MPQTLSRPSFSFHAFALPALALAAGLMLAPAAHASDDAPRTITITGEGEVTAVPDIAYIDTGVVTEGKTAAEALAANTRAMNEVFKGLEEAGIEKRDMQTSQFSVYPVYEQAKDDGRPHTPVIGGYRVQNQLTVKVRDLDKAGAILDRVVTLGSNQLSGIRFEIDNPKPLMNEARKAAVKDALERAKRLLHAPSLLREGHDGDARRSVRRADGGRRADRLRECDARHTDQLTSQTDSAEKDFGRRMTWRRPFSLPVNKIKILT